MKTPHLIETLESRIAPATIVNPTTIAFQDIDGDDVKIHVSKPIFTDPATAAKLAHLSGAFGDTGPQSLSSLEFSDLGAACNGLDIFITAKHSATHGGNGQVTFSVLNASNVNPVTGVGPGIDLGKVVVQGDIRYIDAGDENLTTPAIKSLDLRTLGAVTLGTPSDIFGSIAKMKIRGTMQGVLRTHNGPGNPDLAGIGSIEIGGSMGALDAIAGIIEVAGSIGRFSLAGDLLGGVSQGSGVVQALGDIGSLFIDGSIAGGAGQASGRIYAGGHIDSATIGHSLVGTANATGEILALSIGSLKIGGDIVGGYESESGYILTSAISKLRIGGSLIGGTTISTGAIHMSNGSVKIGGSIIGGLGNQSGFLLMEDGKVAIAGSILGGPEANSGAVQANDLASFTLGGSLIGGESNYSGLVYATGKFSKAAIGGSIRGQIAPSNGQSFAATVFSQDGIGSMIVRGDLLAGNIVTGLAAGGDLQYGTADDADQNAAVTAKLGKLIVKGSVCGTQNGLDHYGIEAEEFGKVKIGTVTYRQGDAGISGPLDFVKGFQVASTSDVLVRAV